MHARLIHNPGAGGGENASSNELIRLLERAGHVVHHEPYDRARIGAWVDDGSDLVVVAGGDGTIGNVAIAMEGRTAPLLVVPTGTANNIGGTLELLTGPDALEQALRSSARKVIDLGIAMGPWGERRFVEGAGVGLFQHTLENEASEDDKEPSDAVQLLSDVLDRYEPRWFEVEFDDRKLEGLFLLVEAMNIRCLGPRLLLAPSADPGDGLLDIVLIAEDDRHLLRSYLDRRLGGEEEVSVAFRVERARHVRIRTRGTSVRLDDRVHPEEPEAAADRVEFRLSTSAVTVLVPGAGEPG